MNMENELKLVRTHERILTNESLTWIQIPLIGNQFVTVGICNARTNGTYAGFTMDGAFCCSGPDIGAVGRETHVKELARTAQIMREKDAAREEESLRNSI